MFDFSKFSQDILTLKSEEDFSKYLESCYTELEEFFHSLSNENMNDIKYDIEEFLHVLLDKNFIQDKNTQTINAFLLLLADKFLQSSMIGAITIIYPFIPSGGTKKRLEAAQLYLKVNDLSKDYFSRFEHILTLLQNSSQDDEYNIKAINSLLYFYYSALLQFQRVDNSSFATQFLQILKSYQKSFPFLQDKVLVNIFLLDDNTTLSTTIELIRKTMNELCCLKTTCTLDTSTIAIENSSYTQMVYNLKNPTFDTIRDLSFQYIQKIGDSQSLYEQLQRGEVVIDDEKLLYKYLVSFGGKHKAKLYSAYDEIFEKIKKEKFNIIDWGCGQATATMALLSYAKENNIVLNIENITLIEPSSLALCRGLLHIDALKQKEYVLQTINSDIDCLNLDDLSIINHSKTLHLFSNILDIESFKLDNTFMQKISDTFKNDNIFVCVSPNRNDKQNNRLNLFYNYFNENFDTELISSRDTDIGNSTRYEKIFEVKYTSQEAVAEAREEIKVVQKSYHLDIIDELSKYSYIVVPILDMKMLEDSLQNNPEYAIYKIRKVAEVITSKLYSNYEENGKKVSFNDKIRYLSYEKKLFDKTITNYVHTLRTIGNSGVHEDDKSVAKLKLDAHLMVIALISFLQELSEKKLIV